MRINFIFLFLILELSNPLFSQTSLLRNANFLNTPNQKLNFTELERSNDFALLRPPTTDLVYIDFVGSGDIQKSISQGDDINANTGIGVIFERFADFDKLVQSFELEATLNIASTADSINSKFEEDRFINRRDFGTYALNPISARQSLYLNSNLYFGYPPNVNSKFLSFLTKNLVSGINLRLITSNNVWTYKDSISNLGVIAFRGGIFHEFIPDNYRIEQGSENFGRSRYSIFLGLNYSYRGIIGDITADKNKVLRDKILGSEQKKFGGFEINFGFRLNNLRAEFQMPILKKDEYSIDGLTNTQFLFSIKFVGGFSLKLNNKTNQEIKDDDGG